MKKAPKMTKADELYLKKFISAREHATQVGTGAIATKGDNKSTTKTPADDDHNEDFNININ